MKFEDLTPEQISELSEIYWNRTLSWDDRMKQLSQYLGKSAVFHCGKACFW